MYYIYVYIIWIFIKFSNCVDFYAGINFNLKELPPDFPILGTFYNKLYFFYSNSVVNNGDNKFDDSYKPLDNIAPGLSLYTDSVYDLDKIPSHIKNKHLLGTLESWCYVLTLFEFYPRFNVNVKHQDSYLYPHLFNRCMNLNYNFTNHKVELDFVNLMVNTDTQLDDVYLFEKFSRMCPRPCYLDKSDVGMCTKSPYLNDLDLANDFAADPGCYFNDFFQKKCVSYSKMMRDSLDSFKELFRPDARLPKYADKWTYLYMPKRVELELSMDNLSYLLFLKVVRNCQNKSCKEIQELLSAGALKNLSVKFAVGRADLTSEDPEKRFNLAFGVTFRVDQFRANNLNHVFDFLVKDVNFDTYYETLLGLSSYTPPSEEEGGEAKEGEKGGSLRDRYNKYVETHLSKYKVKPEDVNGADKVDEVKNKFEFLNLKGLGQHREVTLSVTLNPATLLRFRPRESKFYLKLTHMLDTGVYIDNDEVDNSFEFLKDEAELFKLAPDAVHREDGVGSIKVHWLASPFVDIEQPEMNASPVIYHAYVVLDEAALALKKLVISYSLTLHTRYMNMHKLITPELEKVDNLRLLRNQLSREYGLVMVAQPSLCVLGSLSKFEAVPFDQPYLRSLRFQRKVAFNTFAAAGGPAKTPRPLAPFSWVPVPLGECNDSRRSLKLCQRSRTGLAFSTRVVNTYFCNPIIREMGGDVVESGCHLVFSVPVGDQYEYSFTHNVTLSVILLSCLVSLVMVAKYMNAMVHTVGAKRKGA